MSLDDVNCFPSSLTTAATPPRSGVPSANNCSCCMMISPPQTTTFTPNPIPPASTAHPPRSNCICRAPWCKDFQISLLACGLDTLTGPLPKAPSPNHWAQKEVHPHNGWGGQGHNENLSPGCSALGLWGPLTKGGWNRNSPPPPAAQHPPQLVNSGSRCHGNNRAVVF